MSPQALHIKNLIQAAQKAGIKTYIATSNEQLWDSPKFDEFFKTE